jgi:hypothetical protein
MLALVLRSTLGTDQHLGKSANAPAHQMGATSSFVVIQYGDCGGLFLQEGRFNSAIDGRPHPTSLMCFLKRYILA